MSVGINNYMKEKGSMKTRSVKYFLQKEVLFLTFVIIIAISATGYFKFIKHHTGLPGGCDEFGYLQLSDYISTGNVLNNHNHKDFINELSGHLINQGFEHADYEFLLTPHCHHIDKYSGEKVLQYPLGTSFFLSLFSKDIRPQIFPVIIFLFFLVPIYFSFFYLNYSKSKIIQSSIFLILIISYAIDKFPFAWHLRDINSVSITFGLLFAAGILIREKPFLSILLISATVNFRLGNIVLLPVAILFYLDFQKNKLSTLIIKTLKISSLSFIIGPLIYIIYVYLLTGKFFHTTYSIIDTTSNFNFEKLVSNIYFYFDFQKDWFRCQILSFIILLVIFLKKWVTKKELFLLYFITFFNYVFYLTHNVVIDYYPYATLILIYGFIFGRVIDNLKSNIKYEKYILYFLIILIVMSGLYFKLNQKKDSDYIGIYYSEVKKYRDCFQDQDVVWSEDSSGTVEYATNALGFRYRWGGSNSNIESIKWLRDNRMNQIIWLDDLKFNNNIKKELEDNNIKYEKYVCIGLGEMIYILQ